MSVASLDWDPKPLLPILCTRSFCQPSVFFATHHTFGGRAVGGIVEVLRAQSGRGLGVIGVRCGRPHGVVSVVECPTL